MIADCCTGHSKNTIPHSPEQRYGVHLNYQEQVTIKTDCLKVKSGFTIRRTRPLIYKCINSASWWLHLRHLLEYSLFFDQCMIARHSSRYMHVRAIICVYRIHRTPRLCEALVLAPFYWQFTLLTARLVRSYFIRTICAARLFPVHRWYICRVHCDYEGGDLNS